MCDARVCAVSVLRIVWRFDNGAFIQNYYSTTERDRWSFFIVGLLAETPRLYDWFAG